MCNNILKNCYRRDFGNFRRRNNQYPRSVLLSLASIKRFSLHSEKDEEKTKKKEAPFINQT